MKAMNKQTQHYLKTLRSSAYAGEILTDEATRIIHATDNSIYQIKPDAVLAPRSAKDIREIISSAQNHPDIKFTARGGGTGTNGQSLNHGIIIDTAKHLSDIIEINTKEGWVKIQPGVVLDQLNHALSEHGLVFPPHVSPSKSATLGGMVATDACGKGSRCYGKTSDYILNMNGVLANADTFQTGTYDNSELKNLITDNQKNNEEKIISIL